MEYGSAVARFIAIMMRTRSPLSMWWNSIPWTNSNRARSWIPISRPHNLRQLQ